MESRFAHLLAGYCLDVHSGQTILIEAQPPAMPLVQALIAAVLERGAYPVVLVPQLSQVADFYTKGGDWINKVPAAMQVLLENCHASLRIESQENPLDLQGVDPACLAAYRKGWKPHSEMRLRKRWCSTLYPTSGYAQQGGMSTQDFRAFVERALFLDRPDPIVAWQEVSAFQAKLIERLSQAKEIRLEAEGTDLRMKVEGRGWINSDGKRNMPSGEVFTGPHEESAEGEVRFNLPVVTNGQRVEGVYLRFAKGLVVEARAERGEEYLLRMLDTDPGARRLGELGIGTNFGIDRPIGQILYDEKMGGTVHLALGSGYVETGSTNQSAIHWDLILDLRQGGRIWADGEVVEIRGQGSEGRQ